MTSPPLIFIHYGAPSYLPWVLKRARQLHPHKRIILLGEERNRHLVKGVAEFFYFEEFARGKELAHFEQVFQPIQGKDHHFTKQDGMDAWVKFVFRRWFLMAQFIKAQKIPAFWTFDSDTLLLKNLSLLEKEVSSYPCTMQCRGRCLNGWIGSTELVDSYIRCINELFEDRDYLNKQKNNFKKEVGLAFTEMDAFTEFCHRKGVRPYHLASGVDRGIFDDSLACLDGYEAAPQKILGKTEIKRLWRAPSGQLYVKRIKDGKLLPLWSCNMSWMPDFFWKRLLKATHGVVCLQQTGSPTCKVPNLSTLKEISLKTPFFTTLHRKVYRFLERYK